MKKLTLVLLGVLLFTGCQPAAPASISTAMSEGTSLEASPKSEVSPEASSKYETSSEALPESAAPQTVAAPMPDSIPAQTADALVLPDTLFTGLPGYSLELLTPAQYWVEKPMNRGGFRGYPSSEVFLLKQGERFALANANGKLVSEAVYEQSDQGWLVSAGAVVQKKDGKFGALDAADGSELLPFTYAEAWIVTDDGYFTVSLDENGERGMILDRAGKKLYDNNRGDQFLRLNQETDLLHDGVLKLLRHGTGEPIRNIVCDDVYVVTDPREASGGLAVIGVEGKYGMIDETGAFVAEPLYDALGYAMKGGFIEFTKAGKKGLLNEEGEVVVKAEWDDLLLQESGSASVCKDNKWGIIGDPDSGDLTIETVYDFIGGFDENGYASYERNGKFGVIDRDGNEIIPPKYEGMIYTDANLEKGSFVVTGEDPMCSGVYSEGHLVISTDHAFCSRGISGYVAADEPYNLVRTPNGKWGYVDRKGQFVISAQFDAADGFIERKNVAMVSKEGKICLINREGTVLLETVFSDCMALNSKTMVAAMRYTDAEGRARDCLVRLQLPA